MEYLYHGSKMSGLKVLEPRESTHGTFVYATPYRELAIHFSKRCGSDLVYSIGTFNNSDIWEIVENIPGAFKKMYNTSASIYTVSSESFKDINTGFAEVVSEESVSVIKEEKIDNLYEEILRLEKGGVIKLYHYPDKPEGYPLDSSNILDKWIYYREKLNREFTKGDFDRLIALHPYLIHKINEIIGSFGINYTYQESDLVDIFSWRVERQLNDCVNELYIDSSYISICNTFPNLKDKITAIYDTYIKEVGKDKVKSR